MWANHFQDNSLMLHKPKYYFSNGKLLITGEYLVLRGAKALAMPVRFGQSLEVAGKSNSELIHWETKVKNKTWLSCLFNNKFEITNSNNEVDATFLQKVLKAAKQLRPGFIYHKGKFNGAEVIVNIDFDLSWGLGSSSSLISNIAYWFDINPYDLHFSVSSGSAYDIACARSKSSIIYGIENKVPEIKDVSFNPDYYRNIFFIHLGVKQDSSKSVSEFHNKEKDLQSEIKLISELSSEILNAGKVQDFNYFISEHESIISSVIKQPKVKNLYFSDFEGEIKSLGAWGGDFIMASSNWDNDKIKSYFANKNLNTIFRFDEMNLTRW